MDIQHIYERFLASTGVNTDTRTLEKGNLYFALAGPNFNANAYADQAIEKGASSVIISDSGYKKDDRYIVVDDTLKTLQELATFHRSKFAGKLIALTGSNGKTTTKELLHAVLSKKYNTLATIGNLNNHIGVPLTLLRINSNTEVAIIEMGANHVGEIKTLCEIAKPEAGLITNIGKAHIGTFGGFQNIIKGKTELFQFIDQNQGTLWINESDENLRQAALTTVCNKETYGLSDSSTFVSPENTDPFLSFNYEGRTVTTQLVGDYNFINITAALCVGKHFGVEEEEACKAISEYVPGNNRSQVVVKGSNRIVLDAYNANPSSMKAAIDTIDSMTAIRKMVILGDMFELGEDAEPEHRVIGEKCCEKGFDQIFFVGGLMKFAHEACDASIYFETTEEAIDYVKDLKLSETTILLKGSRGMKMERLVDFIGN